ncbi:MAG: 2Fe-2S iron-sulfur cluster binding domain-containing protein [Pseudomonadales bacterium]|nr:2Fe-2S iron-sulfur cluster binding domain-containing protein [Pseudomonadales bacterium]
MKEVKFVLSTGEEKLYPGATGDSVMDVALDNNVEGIVGQCGGGCTCCTCHVWVVSPAVDTLEPPHKDEVDMLEYAWGRDERSRLSCQIFLDQTDGLVVVAVPRQQA